MTSDFHIRVDNKWQEGKDMKGELQKKKKQWRKGVYNKSGISGSQSVRKV